MLIFNSLVQSIRNIWPSFIYFSMSRKERVGAKPHASVTVLAGTHKYTLNNFLKSRCYLVFFLSSVKENKTASLHKHSSCIKTMGFF